MKKTKKATITESLSRSRLSKLHKNALVSLVMDLQHTVKELQKHQPVFEPLCIIMGDEIDTYAVLKKDVIAILTDILTNELDIALDSSERTVESALNDMKVILVNGVEDVETVSAEGFVQIKGLGWELSLARRPCQGC